MNSLDDLPPLREEIRAAGLQADKKFGQNFLLDLNITRKIVRLAQINPGDHVIEIGPGPGGLTRALLEAGAHVIAYEMDRRVAPILDKMTDYYPLNVHYLDALQVDYVSIPRGTKIVANLPYNIATPLIFMWLSLIYNNSDHIATMNLMVQNEVAERICAAPDNKTYGRLSVMCQWLTECKIVQTLPPSAFTPPPKVHSSVVRFVPRQDKMVVDYHKMEAVVAAAFNQRRKMLRSALSAYNFDWDAIAIDPQKRAEQLNIADFVLLANQS